MRSREELQQLLDRRLPIVARHRPSGVYTLAERFAEQVAARSAHPFLIYGATTLSYSAVDEAVNRTARALHTLGLRCGDVCALVMENRPDFVTAVLALARLGAVAALINTSVRGHPLLHALKTTGAAAVIVGEECLDLFGTIGPDDGPPRWLWPDPDSDAPDARRALCALDLRDHAAGQSGDPTPVQWREGLRAEDTAFLIFTSGTTGLPKAARLSHMRWLIGSDLKPSIMDMTADDVFYCFLPLFHGAAMMSLIGSALSVGGSIVIRRRFSARGFWDDVRRHGVTVTQYVGEICRYLQAQPPRPDDRDHTLRIMMGTGLGAELWVRFQQRFGVAHILEGWGSTESNTSVTNYDNVPGSVGCVPFWDKANLRIVRYDTERETHPRDAAGSLIVCRAGEAGEGIGRIMHRPESGAGRFEGYTSAEATEGKILRDVFEPGDAWWSSGDLLRHDEDGFVWFMDRIGDTFRWRSENVSTQEVAEALYDFPGLEIINVYGVAVPEQEGRAGMAAIVMRQEHDFDPQAFYALTVARLPRYAAPVFLRLWARPEFTASFKLRKVELKQQSYDPALCGDPILVRDEANATYAPYSPELLRRLGLAPASHHGDSRQRSHIS